MEIAAFQRRKIEDISQKQHVTYLLARCECHGDEASVCW